MNLDVQRVSWEVETQRIIHDIRLRVQANEFVGLLGPNGSGKSTLLRCIYRSLQPSTGEMYLNGQNLLTLPAKEVAQKMAVVLQESPIQFDFTVREMVAMGRTPHKKLFDADTSEDWQLVEDALMQVNMLGFAERSFSTLSGGEKQRVLIARALTQQAKFLVLDEPTNHLDIRYQLEILDLVSSLGVATLAALHDLNLAAIYCDKLYILKAGEVVAEGTPNDILTAELIADVYGVSAEVSLHPLTGRLNITYVPASLQENVTS
ncbi:MAG: ABC transporter ATP-binding protein [Chloroflexota bacterium]